MAHPPRSKPPLRSSSGPPNPCITPSTETLVVVVNLTLWSAKSADWGALGLQHSEHHALAQFAGFSIGVRRSGVAILRHLAKQPVRLLVEELCDQVRRVGDLFAFSVGHLQLVQGPLGNHVAINSVGGEVLHVAIEQ